MHRPCGSDTCVPSNYSGQHTRDVLNLTEDEDSTLKKHFVSKKSRCGARPSGWWAPHDPMRRDSLPEAPQLDTSPSCRVGGPHVLINKRTVSLCTECKSRFIVLNMHVYKESGGRISISLSGEGAKSKCATHFTLWAPHPTLMHNIGGKWCSLSQNLCAFRISRERRR